MMPKILILDDEELLVKSLSDYFFDLGWKVNSFQDPDEALKFLKENNVDYATVDLRLMGMNGMEFIKRADSVCPGIRFVVYTGSLETLAVENLTGTGLNKNQLLLKPARSLDVLYKALLSAQPIKRD